MNIKENISELIQLSKSKVGKDSAIVLIGNFLGAGLGFIATILITRTLGPAEFGLFSVALAVMGIASQISDFGISTGLTRFVSLYLKADIQKANLMLKVSLKFKLIITTIVFIIGFFASESLAIHVFGKPELKPILELAFTGAFGTSLVGYISTTLQARQSFAKFTYINLINPFIKITIIVLLYLTYNLNLLSALTTVIIIPFIAFLIGSLIIPRDFLETKGDEKEVLNELYHFSKWILVSVFCVMIFNRLDVIMLTYFKTIEVVGYYSAAYTFAFVFPLVTGTITTVLLPKVSMISEKEQLRNYIKRSLKVSIPFLFPLIILLFISHPLIVYIYGNEYLPAVIIFQILICGFALSIIINPISLIIYSFNKPEILAYLNIMQLILNFIGNVVVIPSYGAIGAAFVTFITSLFASIVVILFVYKLIWSKKYVRNENLH